MEKCFINSNIVKSETAVLEGRRDPQEVFYPYEPHVPHTQYML